MTRAASSTGSRTDGVGVAIVCGWTLLAAFLVVSAANVAFVAAIDRAFAAPETARLLVEYGTGVVLTNLGLLLLL